MIPLSLAGLAAQEPSGVDPLILPLVMLGPAVAWLICRLAVPRWFPTRPDALATPPGTRWRALTAALAVVATFTAVLWLVTPTGTPGLHDGLSPAAGLAGIVAGLTLGSWGEEIGYRGVLYRALSARLGLAASVLVSGVAFGLVHVQRYGDGPLPVLAFVGSTVLLQLAMVAVWHGTWRDRVLVATVIHAGINLAMQLRGADGSRPGRRS